MSSVLSATGQLYEIGEVSPESYGTCVGHLETQSQVRKASARGEPGPGSNGAADKVIRTLHSRREYLERVSPYVASPAWRYIWLSKRRSQTNINAFNS